MEQPSEPLSSSTSSGNKESIAETGEIVELATRQAESNPTSEPPAEQRTSISNNSNTNCNTANNYNGNSIKLDSKITAPNPSSLSYASLHPFSNPDRFKGNNNICNDSSSPLQPRIPHCNFPSDNSMLHFLKMSFSSAGMQQNTALQFWKDHLSTLNTLNMPTQAILEQSEKPITPQTIEMKNELLPKDQSSPELSKLSLISTNSTIAEADGSIRTETVIQDMNCKKRRTRKYTKKACLPCRKAHTSCSDERPCIRCKHRGLECTEADVSNSSNSIVETSNSDFDKPINETKPASLLDLSNLLARVGTQSPDSSTPDQACASVKPVFNCYKKRLRDQFIASNQMESNYCSVNNNCSSSGSSNAVSSTNENASAPFPSLMKQIIFSNHPTPSTDTNNIAKEECSSSSLNEKSRGFITFKNFIESEVSVSEKTKSDILMEYDILYPSIKYSSHEFIVQNFEILLKGKNLPAENLSKILDAYRVSILIDISQLNQQKV